MKATVSTEKFDNKLDELKHSVKHMVDVGGDRAIALKKTAMAQVDKMGAMIKQHPLAAVAIAFGVGYIAMRLFRR